MCGHEELGGDGTGVRVVSTTDLLTVGRHVVGEPEVRRSAVGFTGYGDTKRGDKVPIAVPQHQGPIRTTRSIRSRGYIKLVTLG